MQRVVVYTVILTILIVAGFVVLNALLPFQEPALASERPEQARDVFVKTLALMFFAGALGGCLYNFRGLVKHSQVGDYDSRYDLSYLVRPLSGGVCGLMVFFLLLGGALTLNIGASESRAAWSSMLGRMPYVALSLLSGYGSQEFMLKLKDLSETLFALRKPPSPTSEPKSPVDGGDRGTR